MDQGDYFILYEIHSGNDYMFKDKKTFYCLKTKM